MTSPSSVGGDGRLRLFLALRLPEDALDEVEAWQRAELHGVRVVPREHLHVTLAFLGSRPAEELGRIVSVLREAAAGVDGEIRLTPVRYRETRSVGMLVLDDEDGHAAALAGDVQERLEGLGVYRREARRWLPHLTVARFRGRRLDEARTGAETPASPAAERGSRRPRLRPAEPRVRTFVPSDAAAYLSRLRPSGAQYEVVESVALGSLGGE